MHRPSHCDYRVRRQILNTFTNHSVGPFRGLLTGSREPSGAACRRSCVFGLNGPLSPGRDAAPPRPPVRSPFGVSPFGRPSTSTHDVPSRHHRWPVAVEQRERPIRPWPLQRAVKLPHPSSLLVGPLHRSGRRLDRFVPIALVLPQSFRAPMPRCGAPLYWHGRTCTSAFRYVRCRSVAAFAGSS